MAISRQLAQQLWQSLAAVYRGVNHSTVIRWVRKSANALPNDPQVSGIPEITEIDELQTFVGKKNKRWLWTAVNY